MLSRGVRRLFSSSAVGNGFRAEVIGTEGLKVEFSGGGSISLPSISLRDNDLSVRSRSRETGQKLHTLWDASFDEDLPVRGVEVVSAASVADELVWGGAGRLDGEEEVLKVRVGEEDVLFTRWWLEERAKRPSSEFHAVLESSEEVEGLWGQESPEVRVWDGDRLGRAFQGEPPSVTFDELSTESGLLRFLGLFRVLGVGLVRGCPEEDGSVEEVVGRVGGIVRDVIPFGRMQNVRVEKDVWNYTFANVGLDPHQDNAYRNPVPTVQVIHCLVPSSSGGASTLADGFFLADTLRRQDPEAFAALASYESVNSFRKADDCALSARGKVIETDGSSGRVFATRFNARCIEFFDAPSLETQQAMFRGYRAFGQLANQHALHYHMQAGDAIFYNNRRALHGRQRFEDAASAARWLQTVYCDIDALESRHKIALQRCAQE